MALINEELVEILQYRVNQEELSWRMYRAMQMWLEYNGYFGAAKLWKKYAQEELEHAEWTEQLLLSLNYKPEIRVIEPVKNDFSSLKSIVALSYQHEVDVLKQVEKLTDVADKANCTGKHSVYMLGHRFVQEQVDEINKLQYWVDRLIAFGDDSCNLKLLDDEMGKFATK